MGKYLMIAAACVLVFGCSPRPPLTKDTGKGTIFVLCPAGVIDAKTEVPLMCNNHFTASMAAGTYCEMELLDGQYSLQVGDADPAQTSIPQRVDVNLSAGGLKYFEIVPQAGAAAGTLTLSTITAGAASAKLSKMKKVEVKDSAR